MNQRLKLMADYDCWPLWDLDNPQNIDPSTLKLPDKLLAELTTWADTYNSTLNRETGEAAFKSAEDERAFNEKGKKLYVALKRALPGAEISYFDQEKNAVVTSPRQS